MKRFVVNVLDLVASVAFTLVVFVAPIVAGIGVAIDQGAAMGILTGIGSFIGLLIVGSIVFGTLFILLEMNRNLRELVELQRKAGG